MGVSIKKLFLALANILLFIVWILQLNSGPYLRDRTQFMFVGVFTLWMITGLAHLKVFKVKAKLALLFCQTGLAFALALTDTINRDLHDNRSSQSGTWTAYGQSYKQITRQVRAIYALLWVVFALFFICLVMRILKQFKGSKN
jgi:Ca2+/Na+ antiporter